MPGETVYDLRSRRAAWWARRRERLGNRLRAAFKKLARLVTEKPRCPTDRST